jgi:hypothetical protein
MKRMNPRRDCQCVIEDTRWVGLDALGWWYTGAVVGSWRPRRSDLPLACDDARVMC